MYELLPAFGRPTMATRSGFLAVDSSCGGKAPTTCSTSDCIPRPCSADTLNTFIPNRANSSDFSSSSGRSHLLAAITVGHPDSRTRLSTSSSSGVIPLRTSTTTMHRSESPTASAACARVSSANGSSEPGVLSKAMPPVSTSMNLLPRTVTSRATRSRVTPGWSNTMAMRSRAMRLKRADLPTFGRPTMETVAISL